MKRVTISLMLLFLLEFQTYAATDPRFFGTYCGEDSITVTITYKVCFLFFCDTRTRNETIDIKNIRVNVRYREPKVNVGIVEGGGTAKADGKNLIFHFGGVVSSHGIVRGSAASNFFDPSFGIAQLSSDGLALTVSSRGKSITIRKDQCGNNPPSVSLTTVFGPIFRYGVTIDLFGRVTADEDTSFPPERMAFSSNRDGILTGYTMDFPKGKNLFTNSLSPGNHIITFSATDSGGLIASQSINITVTDDPPEKPTIVQPLADDTVIATGHVILEGKAFDLEEGMLQGGSLVWRSSFEGGPFSVLGTGQRLTTSFDTPGEVTLRLTATDRLGAQSVEERTITVQPFAGNTPPRVTIEIPDQLQTRGPIAAILFPGAQTFKGTVDDTEDPFANLELRWRFEADPPGTSVPDVIGSTLAEVTLTPAVDTYYTVTFSAKDSGGLIGKKVIKILVLPSPIL